MVENMVAKISVTSTSPAPIAMNIVLTFVEAFIHIVGSIFRPIDNCFISTYIYTKKSINNPKMSLKIKKSPLP